MLVSLSAPHISSLQIPRAEGSGEPRGHTAVTTQGDQLPTPPDTPRPGRLPRWPRSEGHAAAQWGQRRVRDPTGALGLSSTPEPPARMMRGLFALLLFTVASGTPIGDQDEDIQVQENFEAERVTAACGSFTLGAEGMGEGFNSLLLPTSGCAGQALTAWPFLGAGWGVASPHTLAGQLQPEQLDR